MIGINVARCKLVCILDNPFGPNYPDMTDRRHQQHRTSGDCVPAISSLQIGQHICSGRPLGRGVAPEVIDTFVKHFFVSRFVERI
jgi:hypothetical protein